MDVLLFGIAKDIIGESEFEVPADDIPKSVQELKEYLIKKFPDFGKLSSFAIAVNSEYAQDNITLNGDEEIAIIPPVSGG